MSRKRSTREPERLSVATAKLSHATITDLLHALAGVADLHAPEPHPEAEDRARCEFCWEFFPCEKFLEVARGFAE